MITLLSSLIIIVTYFLDYTKKKIFWISSSIIIFFLGISYDLKDIKEFEFIFEFDKPKYESVYFYMYLSIVIGYFLGYLIINTNMKAKKCKSINYSLKKLVIIYYALSFISLMSFIINISPFINDISSIPIIMASNIREYEHIFGRYTIINYLYFLNIPAVTIYIFLKYKYSVKLKYAVFINILLITISLFHGIKYTVFDTIMIPFLFYYFLNKDLRISSLLIAFTSLLGFFQLFFLFFRGDRGSFIINLLGYIVPNFYNLIYSIEKQIFQFNGFLSLIWPQKVPYVFSEFVVQGPSGFVLNPLYNMSTGFITMYQTLWFFGPILIIPILFLLMKILTNIKDRNILYLFLSVYFFYSMIFLFYFYPFTKPKYLYYIGVYVLIHAIALKRKTINVI